MTLPVLIHVTAAVVALPLGAALLSERLKGERMHRIAGWTWTVLVAAAALSALWIPSFMKLTWIHVFVLVVAVTLPLGIYRARQHNVKAHRAAMIGVFSGLLIAGLLAIVPGRSLGNALLRWLA